MKTLDLIKLAPTLSAEERFRILLPDVQRETMGEKPLISESERCALLKFDNREIWEEYATHALMYQWGSALWSREIESEKLRTFACYLMLNEQFKKIVFRANEKKSTDERAREFEDLKKHVLDLEKHSQEFFAFRIALDKIKEELYGIPLFDLSKSNRIEGYYLSLEDLIQNYNEMVKAVCSWTHLRRYVGPILKEQDCYLVKKSENYESIADEFVSLIKMQAESELKLMR